MDTSAKQLRERLLEQLRTRRDPPDWAAPGERILVDGVFRDAPQPSDDRETVDATLLSEIAAVSPEEWREACSSQTERGQYTVVLRGLNGWDGDEFWTYDRDFMALAVAVHAGVLPPVADELLKRAEHVGPQQVVEGLGLDEAIAVKLDLEHWGGRVKLKEGAVRKTLSREAIPERVRHEVWRRDGGRCASCESRERLEFDHIIPVSEGGSNTARNLQLLCEECNRKKAADI